jgi:hypothetical protein
MRRDGDRVQLLEMYECTVGRDAQFWIDLNIGSGKQTLRTTSEVLTIVETRPESATAPTIEHAGPAGIQTLTDATSGRFILLTAAAAAYEIVIDEMTLRCDGAEADLGITGIDPTVTHRITEVVDASVGRPLEVTVDSSALSRRRLRTETEILAIFRALPDDPSGPLAT